MKSGKHIAQEDKKCIQNFCYKTSKETTEYLSVDGRIILRSILNKQGKTE
jgi:hypothetical protein